MDYYREWWVVFRGKVGFGEFRKDVGGLRELIGRGGLEEVVWVDGYVIRREGWSVFLLFLELIVVGEYLRVNFILDEE